MSETKRNVATAFIGGAVAFLFTTVIMLVSLFAGSIWASTITAFPTTLMFFALAASIMKDAKQEINFDRYLLLSAGLYFILSVGVLIWWLVTFYGPQSTKPFIPRTWIGFGAGITIWVATVIILLTLYYTNEDWYRYFNPDAQPENEVVTALPPLPPPIPIL